MAEVKRRIHIPKTGMRVTATLAVLCMAVGLNITASAAGTDKNNENDSGKTTVRVGVRREIPRPVSFEVPLYYTAAIVKTEPDQNNNRNNKIIYPEGYYIKNIYDDIDVDSADKDIGKYKIEGSKKELVVASIQVASVDGATWDLVDTLGKDETEKKMAVKLGGLQLPTIQKGNKTFVDVDLKKAKSIFYDPQSGYTVVGDHDGDGIHDGNGQMDLDLQIEIPASYIPQNSQTVMQFRVAYTLTTKNDDGTLVGNWDQAWVDRDYFGPGHAEAEPESAETTKDSTN